MDLDALTLDQIRLFALVAETGSFSAAARRLHRAQSSVSYGISNLERLLGLSLFDRGRRRPRLTEAGRGLLADARRVLEAAGDLRARAAGLAEGMEASLRLAVDVICPARLLIEIGRTFQAHFPTVALHIQTDVLEAVAALVLDGTCHLGICGPIGDDPGRLARHPLAEVPMVPVAGAGHRLASLPSPLTRAQLRDEVQIVISQRSASTRGADHGVLSENTWRVADTATKLGLIRAGLGWGNLPLELVRDDLERGTLVHLDMEGRGERPLLARLDTVTRRDAPPGPAGQWLLSSLGEICQRLSPEVLVAVPGS